MANEFQYPRLGDMGNDRHFPTRKNLFCALHALLLSQLPSLTIEFQV